MDATSAPLTDKDRRPEGEQRLFKGVCTLKSESNQSQAERVRAHITNTLTNDGIQSDGTLSEHLFVARHCRALLTSFPVQVS